MTLPLVPTYIPIKDAAVKYGYGLLELKKMAQSGKINAVKLPDGDLVVSEDKLKDTLPKEKLPEYKKHKELAEQTIWVSKATRKYSISHPTINRWVSLGFIKKMGTQGNKVLLNAQDVAYCAEVYRLRGGGQGKRIFAKDGTPYKSNPALLAV